MESGKLLKLSLILLILPFVKSKEIQKNEEDDSPTFRLPEDLIPESYDLSVLIEPEKDVFNGTVNITFHLADENSTVQNIYLHADPQYITLTSAEMNEAFLCNIESVDATTDIVKIFCGNVTEKDNFLYIEFNGTYSNKDGYGLVKTSYVDQEEEQFLIESYFEPTYARRAFPCFDEPDLKATFSIEITCPAEYSVISNTIRNSVRLNNYITSGFESTPKISTYLVSIFVSKFQEVPNTYADEGYTFKVLTRPSLTNLTTQVAGAYYSQIMEGLSSFTGQSFQELGNVECYQVAIPDYYSENMGFGLFAYRETDLIDEGDRTTAKVEQHILQSMAYKLSHQWFGGEISTKWWSDVWVNEAVAVYLKYIIPNKINEEFELTNQFVVDVVQKGMQYDAMPYVQPLSSNETDVNDEWAIENKLDQYSLIKGATLLHMINFMLRGEDQFKANLQNYLQNRKGLDTDSQDILKDLALSDGIQDLYSAYESWVYTPGFPLLNVKITNSTEEKEMLLVSQKRFIYPVNNTTTFDEDVKWTIPVSFTSSSSKNFNTGINVFYTPNIQLNFNNNKGDWVIFNIQGRLHYRVNYEEELWKRLINSLKNESDRTDIHPLNRAQIIDDIFSIARIGDVEYSLAFELADFLVNETEYYPWRSAFNGFSYLLGKMKDDDVEGNLKRYILDLMVNVINIPDTNSVTQENYTHIDILKQVMVLDWACELGHSDCITFATEQFSNFKENQESIEDYNLRSIIFCNGIKYSENVSSDWNFLWNRYLTASSVHEQNDILYALGCTTDKETLTTYLLKTVSSSSDIKRQDALVVFESVLRSPAGIEVAMSFLKSSFANIQLAFNGNSNEVHVLTEMIYLLAEKLVTDEQLKWLEDVLGNKILDNYEELKSRAKVLATVNNYWAVQYQDILKNIFPEISTSTSTESTSSEATVTGQSTSESTPIAPNTTTGSSSATESTVTGQSTSESTSESTTSEPSTTTESSAEKLSMSKFAIAVYSLIILIHRCQ